LKGNVKAPQIGRKTEKGIYDQVRVNLFFGGFLSVRSTGLPEKAAGKNSQKTIGLKQTVLTVADVYLAEISCKPP